MIDTVKGYLNLDPETNPVLISELKPILDNPKSLENGLSQTGYLKGQIRNFKISIRYSLSDQLPFLIGFEGSIPKFLYGNNIAQVSPNDVQTVLDALSDSLSITLDDAKITRLDFGCNFVVSHPIPYYIQAIQDFPRLKRVLYQGESVTFQTSSDRRKITFYDKLKEMRKDRKSREAYKALPDFIKTLSILRYEVKLRKTALKNLKLNIKFSDHNDPTFFNSLNDYLIESFKQVRIIESDIPSNSFVSTGWLKDFLAYIGLQKYGVNETLNLIENHKYSVKNPSVARSQHRRQIRVLADKSEEILQTSIKSELEETMASVYGILMQFK